MPLNVRTYECRACGFVADRDYNAAVNILNIGMAGTATTNACGDTTNSFRAYDWNEYVSMKQEAVSPTDQSALHSVL